MLGGRGMCVRAPRGVEGPFPRAAKKIKSTTWPGAPAIDSLEIQYALPVWHAGAHETICQTENSLSYAGGVGRTDGEGSRGHGRYLIDWVLRPRRWDPVHDTTLLRIRWTT
ncbi:hypothetical protein B0H12DRAFT_1072894 [Mycena haematopus]|nr:hypothetical protein B0H12DRAFT_1072894 [Mycena haematopus]